MGFGGIYHLVNVEVTMENHNLEWENSLYMAMFNSYVNLAEGKSCPSNKRQNTLRNKNHQN